MSKLIAVLNTGDMGEHWMSNEGTVLQNVYSM